jgi:hypothetical protein
VVRVVAVCLCRFLQTAMKFGPFVRPIFYTMDIQAIE